MIPWAHLYRLSFSSIVFILIAVRRIGSVDLRIWQVMLIGAVVVVLTGSITPGDALASINTDLMLSLFRMKMAL